MGIGGNTHKSETARKSLLRSLADLPEKIRCPDPGCRRYCVNRKRTLAAIVSNTLVRSAVHCAEGQFCT